MGILSGLLSGGIEGIASGVDKVAARFTVNKDLQETNVSAEQQAVNAQYAAEFQDRANRTWFDSFADGLNRLPRPLWALSAWSIFPWCVADPLGFSESMQALQLIPDAMWNLIYLVGVFYFGGRTLEKTVPSFAGPSKARVQEILAGIKEIRALRAPASTVIDDAAYQAQMKDTATPLSDAAIEEWNRRRKA